METLVEDRRARGRLLLLLRGIHLCMSSISLELLLLLLLLGLRGLVEILGCRVKLGVGLRFELASKTFKTVLNEHEALIVLN